MRNQILGIDPSEVHTEQVHATGTRAVDLNDPNQEYIYARVASAIAEDDLVTFDVTAADVLTAVSIGATAGQVCGVRDQAAVDGSTTVSYAWFLVRGLWSGASGLTDDLHYSHLTSAGGALQASTTVAFGTARSTTSLQIYGWGSPGVAPFLLGVNPDHVHSEAQHELGTRATLQGSANEYIYLKVPAGDTVAVGDFGVFDANFEWDSTGEGRYVAVTAVASSASDQYAWFQTRGFNDDITNGADSAIDAAGTAQTDGFIRDSDGAGAQAFLL